ncbi:MAG: hypothetical protein JXO22_00005, partial [Phycisphaerae bacterium]|nr:hypothetical protein [Phycisphaerae bacterium]
KLQADAQLLPGDKDGGKLTLALEWDHAATVWKPAAGGELVEHGLALAASITQAVVVESLVAKSAALRPHRPALVVALQPSAEEQHARLPRSLIYGTHISLRSGDDAGEFALDHLTVVCEQVGKATFELDLAGIESKLAEITLGVQEGYRQALLAGLQRWAESAPAPMKISVVPAAVREPTATLRFALKPKSGAGQTITADWDAASFAYVFSKGWQKAAEPLLGSPPDNFGKVKVECVSAARAMPARKPMVLVGGTVGVLAVLSFAVWHFALRGPSTNTVERQAAPPTMTVATNEPTTSEPRIVIEPQPEPVIEPPPDTSATAIVTASDANEPTVKPDTPPEPVGPTPAELAQELNDYLRERLQGGADGRPTFDALFATLLPPESLQADGPAPAAINTLKQLSSLRGISNYQPAGESRFTFDVQVALKADAGGRTQTFVMQRGDGAWLPSAENMANLDTLVSGARTALLSTIAAAGDEIRQSRDQGSLVTAHRRLDGITDVLEALAGAPEADAVRALGQSIPPSWSRIQADFAGYEAVGGIDAATGYPRQLRRGAETALSLVSVPPGDPLWSELRGLGDVIESADPLHGSVQTPTDNQPWRIYYMDSAERSAQNTYEQAVAQSDTLGQQLPTRDEWLLAALKLRAAGMSDLAGGRYEWCADDTGDPALHWVCGGATVSVGGQPRVLPPPPAGDDLAAWWRWFKHPLVMQTRSGSDDLTALRTVMRVFPPTGA